ncbi:hypothetical protein NHX12_006433 [Muraenolepis orangiensis]|uniref:Lymphocyte antigen 75 n=1 Tax=Muraenolepis orangiensis TaxID=630683 RepID=A0A9Q0IEK5_9TELE|nr:hypothetical protein NHX12_006433 [Muraenolepis orangiensis]
MSSESCKVVVSLCFFLLWDLHGGAPRFGSCAPTHGGHDEDAFAIRHVSTGQCLISEGPAGIGLGPCPLASSPAPSPSPSPVVAAPPPQVWKWGSGERLFHVPTALCLGLEVRSKKLALFRCGSSSVEGALRWRCQEGTLLTAYQMGLAVSDQKVVAKRDATDLWAADEGPGGVCQRAYRGQSAGDPCEFPFLANGSWHHGCLEWADSPGTFWCSSTSDYDRDGLRGRCLLPEEGCSSLFTKAGPGQCYEFVSNAAVTWQQALDSCRSQGADLLSLVAPEDLTSPTFVAGMRGMPEKMWIGLHQLDTSQGWQWSDGRPLAFLRWEKEMPSASILLESDCGALNSEKNFLSESCSEKLPYVCRKTTGTPGPDAPGSLDYRSTVCPEGWVPWSGWCYRLEKDRPQSFADAQVSCGGPEAVGGGGGGTLASLHSLDAKEMISTRFHAEGLPLDVWLGFIGTNTEGTVFSWADQSAITFTYWGPNQPSQPTQSPSCLSSWQVGNCSDPLPFLCQKKGEIDEAVPSASCPVEGGWRRHGDSCYRVDPTEVSFKDRCNITIRNGFEQAFVSRLLGEQISPKTRYFWIGLQDIKSTGEYQWLSPDGGQDPVTYTNWGWVEPERQGGCAVMSTAKPLGNSCYKVFHEERLSRKRSWEEAFRFCRSLGADLPSFTNDGRPVSLSILHQDFHHDDEYSRDCTAFKTMKSSLKQLLEFLLHDLDPWPFYATPFHCGAALEWEWHPRSQNGTTLTGTTRRPCSWTLSFQEASLFCSMNGSKLAAPMSFTAAQLIHNNLAQMSSSPKQSWWVDIKQPGRYFPMTFSQMHFYHSVFLGRCTSLSTENLSPEYDYSCEHKLSFVCERHNMTSVERNPLEPNPGGFPCENSSLAFRDKCFTVLQPSQRVSFKVASEECLSHRGTLVTVSDQVEQDFITTLLPNMTGMQHIWIGLKLRSTYREWMDDTPVVYQNFNPLLHGMLRPMSIRPDSEVMGTWDYSGCTEEQYMGLCQHYTDKQAAPWAQLEQIHINNHTVQLLLGNMTWLQALEQCRALDMDLASVADAHLQASLTVLVSRARTPMWIGFFSDDGGVHYRWTDHSHTRFSRWSQEASIGTCVYQDTDGFWKTAECEETLGGAICHKPHDEAMVRRKDVMVKCPHTIKGPNWLPFGKNCYAFQLVASRWDQLEKGHIRDTCKDLYNNSNILTIRNTEENEFVRQQLLPFQNLVQFVWLGLFKDRKDNQMKWYEGSNVQFSNWRYGRPDVAEDFMAGLNKDGVWELITNEHYFSPFRQRSIVACKLENDPKDQYNQALQNLQDYGSLTYRVATRKLTWYQALEECARHGGHLASIHDDQHNAHLKLMAQTDGFPLWIGLSNHDTSGVVYEWSDGTSYNYTPTAFLDSLKSAPPVSQAGCVYVRTTGEWTMADCNTLAEGAVCYNTNTTTAFQRAKLKTPAVSNNCPLTGATSNWVEFQDHCYAFDMSLFNSTVYNMHDALGICRNLGALLLTVTSIEENQFVSSQVSGDPLITSRVWLGLDLDPHGAPVSWVDDSPLGFSNWAPKAGGALATHPCAVLDARDPEGLWWRVGCSRSHSRVVCKTARSKGSPVALVLLLIILVGLVGALVFLVYKKKKSYFSSTVRYKRNFDEADSTSIITEAE